MFASRRARASVIWTLVVFALFQVGLGALIEIGVFQPSDLTAYTYRIRRLRERLHERGTPSFLALMFGSSRVQNDWRAEAIEQQLTAWVDRPPVAYNFGVPGGGHIYSYYSLQRLLAEGVRPDLVLIEVFPAFLAEQAITELQWFGNRGWSTHLDDEQQWKTHSSPNRWWETWLTPWYSYRFSLLNLIAPELLPRHLLGNDLKDADMYGWIANERPPKTEEAIEHDRRQFASHFDNFQVGGPSAEALRRAVDLCHRNGIRVVLTLLPEASEMRSWYSADMRSQVGHFLDRLREETSVPIVDARAWIADEDFSDANHLRVPGATDFTERFVRTVLPKVFDGTTSDRPPLHPLNHHGAISPLGAQIPPSLPRRGSGGGRPFGHGRQPALSADEEKSAARRLLLPIVSDSKALERNY